MKKVLFIIHCSFFIVHCSLTHAETYNVCKKDMYNDCVSKLGPFFTVTTGAGGHRYVTGAGGYSGTETWQWLPSGTGTSGALTTTTPRVNGTHVCSTNNGTYGHIGTPTGSNGRYCWCRMTSINGTSCQGVWVFHDDNDSASNCSGYCTGNCAFNVQQNGNFRAAVLALP